MTEAKKGVCENCRFFELYEEDDPLLEPSNEGDCHRYPPAGVHSTVLVHDWCGEFKENEK